jgi:DHA1 family multidrug resistance protein-like MFS transporter
VLIGFFVVASFMAGVLIPAFGAMTGLESPRLVQATIFGFASSGISVGFGLGPLIGGLVASAAGVRVAMLVAAGIAMALVILLAVAVREPKPPAQPTRVVAPAP